MSQYFQHRGNVFLKASAFVSNFAEREQEQKVINRQQWCAAMVHFVLLWSTLCGYGPLETAINSGQCYHIVIMTIAILFNNSIRIVYNICANNPAIHSACLHT